MTLNRRRFLKGLGGLTLALPWLEALDHRAWGQGMPARPKRVVVMTYQMGVPRGAWRPSATGTTFTLPYVTAPLEPFKSRCLFVSDIDHRMLDAGGSAFSFGHPGKSEAALTGTLTTGAFPTTNGNALADLRPDPQTSGGANSESIEQLIGLALRAGQPFGAVNVGIDGDRNTPSSLQSRFFFEGRGTAVTLDCNPTTVFNRFFSNVMPTDPGDTALRELRARNKSVLDAVRREFVDLRTGLGTDDRRRLDEHAARIRQVELVATPPATCVRPTGITALTRPNMAQVAPLQLRLLAQAMACDLAPIGRVEFGNQQNPRFGITGLDSTLDQASAASGYDWHGMVHGDPLPGTNTYLRPGRDAAVTTYDMRLLDGYRFFVQQFANLLAELDRFPEGPNTTALDNTLCILASDLGEGSGHHHGKMGYVLAGNVGAARRGFHFNASPPNAGFYTSSTYNVSQLLHSVLDMAGVGTGGGGTVAELGLRGFLQSINAPRRIDALFA